MEIVILSLIIFWLNSYVFCASSYTITSDIQFNNLNRENVTILGQSDDAILLLNNHFEKLKLTNFPLKRHSYASDYSSATKKVFLFGGIDDEAYPLKIYNDCWYFDVVASSWVKLHISSSPQARYGHSLVNISADKFLLFGGLSNNGYCNDTYVFSFSEKTFQLVETSTSPLQRYYHSMCFVTEENKVYLFGGNFAGTPLNDMWCFDIKNLNWQKLSPINSPSPRWGHKMLYSSKNKKIYIISGQKDYTNAGILNDIWEFDLQTNDFLQIPIQQFTPRTNFAAEIFNEINNIIIFAGYLGAQTYTNELWFYNYETSLFTKAFELSYNFPTPREKTCLTYIGDNRFLIFGGNNGVKPLDDTYIYHYSTHGVILSDTIFIYSPTQLYYQQLSFSPSTLPDGSEIKFQISYSTDNKNFSEFLGPDGTKDTYFTPYQQNFLSNEFNNKQYIKLKGLLSTSKPPNNPYIEEIVIRYNLAPYPPILVNPQNNLSLNTLAPTFIWQPTGDPDGDEIFSYHFQLSKNETFSQLIEDIKNYPNTFYTIQTLLQTGVYFWRVSCYDTNESKFSNYYIVEIDTTPPNPTNYIKAYTGISNNQIAIETRITGDDRTDGDFNGKIIVAYSSVNFILTELDFQNAKKYIYKPPKQLPNSLLNFTVDGLQNDTTYFINVKFEDEAGNLSEISTISVSAITNFTPEIKILTPVVNSTVKGDKVQITWEYSDNNTEDIHRFQILLSTDNKNFFPVSPTLSNKTTYYLWNSLSVKNNIYSLKVEVYDQRNLKGEDIIQNLQVLNSNFAPKILNLEYPKQDDILVGTVKISWQMYDPNLADTHTYKLFISTDNINFLLIDNIKYDTTFYFLDTTKFPNGRNYRLKIFVTDGEFSDEFISDIFLIKNDNYPPTKPLLFYPKNLSFTSPYKIKFQWQESVDYNFKDKVLYDFYLSTHPNFEVIVFSSYNLNQNYVEVKYPLLQPEQNYYWYVKAKDIFEEYTNSEIYMFRTLSKYKAISDDYKVYAELLEIPKENCFIYISKLCNSSQRENFFIISSADAKDKTDRFIKVLPIEVYEINLYDENFKPIEANFKYKLVYSIEDKFQNKESLKVVYFEPDTYRWSFIGSEQKLVKSQQYGLANPDAVEFTTSQYGYLTLLAKDTTYEPVSHITIYPNPFDPTKEKLTIEYILTEDLNIEVYILTLSGGLVKKLEFQKGLIGTTKGLPEGILNSIIWDGKNEKNEVVASGMYICKLIFEDKVFYKYIGVVKR